MKKRTYNVCEAMAETLLGMAEDFHQNENGWPDEIWVSPLVEVQLIIQARGYGNCLITNSGERIPIFIDDKLTWEIRMNKGQEAPRIVSKRITEQKVNN